MDAYDVGNYGDAVAKLEPAHAAVQVPILGLWLARFPAKTGRLVDAAEATIRDAKDDWSALAPSAAESTSG